MKHLLILFFFFALLITANAQAGDCVVFSPEGEYFYIALDNKFQNAKAHKNIKIKNIPEGDYWVTILFFDKNKKAIKTNMKLRASREITYKLDNEGDVWRLTEYANIPKIQAKTINSAQMVMSYEATGVEVQGIKSADKIPNNMVHTTTEPSRVRGERSEIEEKREGKFTFSEKTGDPNTAVATPQPKEEEPETGTIITIEYIEVDKGDGTTTIVEQKTTAFKEVVEKNGQRFLRTKKNTEQFDTDFTCLPMKKDPFLAIKESVSKAEDKAATASAAIKDKCMTPSQIKVLGDLIKDKNARNDFAIAAKDVCASPNKFPFTIEEPVVAVVEKKVEKEVEVIEEPVTPPTPKTKAELKAELKVAKAREKAAKKAAKAKAKAEKKAAKEKAKAEKKAAKEAEKEKAKAIKARAKAVLLSFIQ